MYLPSTEAEISLIGCMLLFPETFPEIRGEIEASDLYFEESRAIYRAMEELEKEGKGIDHVTVLHEIGYAHKSFALRAMDLIPSVNGLREYIAIVQKESKKRSAQEILSEMSETLLTGTLEDLQLQAGRLNDILFYEKREDEMPLNKGIAAFIDAKEKPREYIKTGFKMLDRKTYIDRGDYIVIGGRPSAGKTAFAVNLAMNLAENHNVVFFSLETSGVKIIDRLITAYCKLDYGNVKQHALSDDEWKSVIFNSKKVKKLSFTVVSAAGRNVSWIQSKALKLKADVIFIDYLGLLQAEGRTRYEKVTNISVDLHVMAQRTGIVVFALSQLNRNGIGIPTMEDLRESGQIEQDADLILLLHNDVENGEYNVIAAKNKEGETGVVPFMFYGSRQYFKDLGE